MPNRVDPDLRAEVKAEFKQSDDDENIMEGYASVFGNIDEVGDIVQQGAFAKTIQERVPTGQVKMVDSHMWTASDTIGTVVHAEEDEKGLFVRVKMATTPDAQEIKQKMEEGHVDRMSFAFDVIESEEREDGKGRYLKELKLLEVSATPVPANPEAEITGVKGLPEDELCDDCKKTLGVETGEKTGERDDDDDEDEKVSAMGLNARAAKIRGELLTIE